MRRLCQLESVPCESVSIRRTVCPAWIAARARPIASVLLPLPPFWVASTIVCIPRSVCYEICGYATLSSIAVYDAEQFSLRTCRPDPEIFRGSRLSESPNAVMMTGYEAYGYSGRIRD